MMTTLSILLGVVVLAGAALLMLTLFGALPRPASLLVAFLIVLILILFLSGDVTF